MLLVIAATGNKKYAVGKGERCPGDTQRKENEEEGIWYRFLLCEASKKKSMRVPFPAA